MEIFLKFQNPSKKLVFLWMTDLNDVLEKIKKHNLQAVQLHGHESPEYCELNVIRNQII